MSDLVVIAFKEESKADEALIVFNKMQREYLIDIEDTCIVVRNKYGRLMLKRAHSQLAIGALWGLLFGWLFMSPIIGLILGAGIGVILEKMAGIGIDDDFARQLGAMVETGSSALVIIVKKITPDKMLNELKYFEGKVLKTSLSEQDERKLQASL